MNDSTECQVFFNKAEFLKALELVGKTDLLKYDYHISHNSGFPYVQKGEVFCNVQVGIKSLVKYQGSSIYQEIPIKSPCSGYVFYDPIGSYRGFRNCEDGELIATILGNPNEVSDKFENEVKVITDDFTGASVIEWVRVCGSKSSKAFRFEGIYIVLTLLNNKPCIRVIYDGENERYKKGDIFEILLSDSNVLTFILPDNPVRVVGSKNYKFDCKINIDTIVAMKNCDVLKIRLRKKDNSSSHILGNNCSFIDKTISQILFRRYVEVYDSALTDVGFQWNDEEISLNSTDPCYVYLMIDTANGYHKIGISNKPEYRERTLQSEKPTIEKVCARQYPSRTIAEAIETALHKAFESKRIRGEWFNLSQDEVEMIKDTLK